jgi:hypothetical protein
MADFSTILQSPEVRQLVQENLLERAFHDALFPSLLFRGEAKSQRWPNHAGDTHIFSGTGLIAPKQKPLVPGTDPAPSSYDTEQWEATLQQYADSIDTHMPTSIAANVDLFLRNAQQLGLTAGQTLNRIVRNNMYNAALSGNTIATAISAGTVVTVRYLNGLTTARSGSGGASPVRFTTVSVSNPLAVTIGGTERNIVGFTPDTPGDEIGPGTITIDSALAVAVADPILTADRSNIVRVGGGTSSRAVGSNDTLRLQDIRAAVSRFRQQNVPWMPDGYYHCHLSPKSESQIYSDPEWQRLNTSLPDAYYYKDFAIGHILGCMFFRNSETPTAETVQPFDGVTFSEEDPFAGELTNDGTTTGTPIERPLFVAQGGIYEHYQDLDSLITEAGVTGKVGEPSITNNGIRVNADRVQLIIRSPLNRLQDLVSTSWKFIGAWPVRTDATTGDAARHKRFVVIEHGA